MSASTTTNSADTDSNSSQIPETKKVEDLRGFELKDILSSGRLGASIHCQEKDTGNQAVLIFNRKPFSSDQLSEQGFLNKETSVQTVLQNDIYTSYDCRPPPHLAGITLTVVNPATEKHIEKYRDQAKYIILETPALYKDFILPYLKDNQFTLDWVYNILDGTKEADRVIYSNPDPEVGFVLLPDLKWDGLDPKGLDLLAITRKRDILSLRDLTTEHLPLLRALRDEAQDAIFKKYGYDKSQLRIYFHYQPSFYHLHVHYSFIKHEPPGIFVEKSHMLDTVIDNIELMGDYYQKATLPFVVREKDKLYQQYLELKNSDNGHEQSV